MTSASGEGAEDVELPALVVHDGNILFARVDDPRSLPPRVHRDGIAYRRFMDRILIPAASDELTSEQIVVVNRLRLQLIKAGHPMVPNAAVKVAVGRLVTVLGARKVVEWGPGIDPLVSYCEVDNYLGVDLDETVRSALAQRRIRCMAPEDLTLDTVAPVDLVVAIFVFHFRLPNDQIRTMRQLVGDHGTIFANVYLRDADSRIDLMTTFDRAGLRCAVRSDPWGLCRDHEFWTLSAGDPSAVLDTFETLYRDVVAALGNN